MALLQQWRDMAYSETANKGDLQRLWSAYFQKEKEIYAQLLKTPDKAVKGTVKELADKYEVDLMTMVGFLDGINDSLKKAKPIIWRSGTRSSMRTRERLSTGSRKSPRQSIRIRRFIPTIPVPAEAARNIKSAAGRTHRIILSFTFESIWHRIGIELIG